MYRYRRIAASDAAMSASMMIFSYVSVASFGFRIQKPTPSGDTPGGTLAQWGVQGGAYQNQRKQTKTTQKKTKYSWVGEHPT